MYKINNECVVWGVDLPAALKLIIENQCGSENDAITLAATS